MEYTYQNSASDCPCTASLNEYTLTIRSLAEENVIPYPMITEVRLIRESAKRYKIALLLNNNLTQIISNKSFTDDKRMIDRSREYSTFVRVLHFYLEDKSRAIFTLGNPDRKTWYRITFSVIVSFLISFTAEYFGISLVNPIIQALVLIAMMAILILAINMGRWPKQYQPNDIPLEFLP